MLPPSATTSPGKRRTLFGTLLMRTSRASCPAGAGLSVGVGVGIGVGVGVAVGVQPAHAVAVGVGEGVWNCTPTQLENSEVLPKGSIAVATKARSELSKKVRVLLQFASPLPLVVAVVDPPSFWAAVNDPTGHRTNGSVK